MNNRVAMIKITNDMLLEIDRRNMNAKEMKEYIGRFNGINVQQIHFDLSDGEILSDGKTLYLPLSKRLSNMKRDTKRRQRKFNKKCLYELVAMLGRMGISYHTKTD